MILLKVKYVRKTGCKIWKNVFHLIRLFVMMKLLWYELCEKNLEGCYFGYGSGNMEPLWISREKYWQWRTFGD